MEVTTSLSSLIDTSLKVKQKYLSNVTQKKVLILREEVVIERTMKFSTSMLTRVLRILLRMGYFPSEIVSDVDTIGFTTSLKIVFDSASKDEDGTTLMKVLKPIAYELIANDVQITSNRSQTEVVIVELTKPPLKTIKVLYEPLGLSMNMESYGVLEIGGVTSYIFAVAIEGTSKRACTKYLIPSEMLVRPSVLTDIQQLVSATTLFDVFALPDRVKIVYNMKTDTGFTHDGVVVAFGKASFLSTVLPSSGWFVKVNKRIGRTDTVLLIETSWELTPSQRSYVTKNL